MNFDISVLDDTERMIFALRTLYMKHGYTQYRMSKFEEYDLYSRNKDFLVSDGVVTFTDTNGRLMALKPDVTLSIIKNNRDEEGVVKKLCYNENVYRISRSTNTFREIMQAGLECIGDVDESCVAEVLCLAAESLAICDSDFVLEVSHLGILSKFVEDISEDPQIRQSILKCAGEKNLHEITEICKRNNIDLEKAEPLKRLLGLYGSVRDELPKLIDIAGGRADAEINAIREALSCFVGTGFEKSIKLDFSLTGDTNYYNGIIFKGYVEGVSGSVLSGGRYDNLMRRMGRRSKAIGFAVYLDMLDRRSGGVNA